MSTYPRIEVNGVPLDDSAGRWGMHPDQVLRVGAPRRATSVPVPGRAGALRPSREVPDVTTFPIKVRVVGEWSNDPDTRVANLEYALDGLQALFSADSVTVDYFVTATSVKRADARRLSTDIQRINSDAADVTFAMEIPDSYWRGNNNDIQTRTSAQGAVAGVVVNLDNLAGSTAPITDAQILVGGPFTSVAILDQLTGQRVSYTGTVAAGRWLRIDCQAFTAQILTSASWTATGSDVSSQIRNIGPGSNGSWLTLNPTILANDPLQRVVQVIFTMAGTTSATSWQIRARKAYL